MQIDFHHTAIYVLCRLAGMKSEYAEITAYASQQVDDAVYSHALKFENGGIFKQTRTGHRGLNRKLVDISDAFEVWIPFHFIPGGEGDTISEKLVTRPEGKTMKLLKKDIIGSGDESHGLHRLGIGLHLYADAYSHQDFKGFFDDYNDIELITALERKTFPAVIIDWLMRTFSFLAPVGHGQALKNPDIPYVSWSYSRNDDEIIYVDNIKDRFSPAIDNIYSFIVRFLKDNYQYAVLQPVKDIGPYKQKMISLLKRRGGPFARHADWLDAVRNNYFEFKDFDRVDWSLTYKPRAWFKTAVNYVKTASLLDKIKNSYAHYYTFKKEGRFADSNWVKYMRAAAIHKYRLLHKILPECGLDLG